MATVTPCGQADKRLIQRLAVALAEFYGAPLSEKHFRQAQKLLIRKDSPLQDRVLGMPFTPDISAMVG